MVNNKERYFYATGRRKTAVAKVRVFEKGEKAGIMINDLVCEEYFDDNKVLVEKAYSPLDLFSLKDKYFVSVKVLGGGSTGQAEAVRLGISRALLKIQEDFKKDLKDKGYLTRDPREVERKKPGLKKARRAPQWKKR
ncbi:MAG: 30S ribosomal protein S9 [Candidatus Pacebacteria bacterium]|nr:30S ribosomal protein S9 [Candidatus Paceibacterota bacterium]